MPAGTGGRQGGAGPAEGRVLVIDGIYLNVPAQSWYVVSSPYHLQRQGRDFYLYRGEERLCRAELPARPRYYDLKTPSGIPLEKLALVHGKECFASTIYQGCLYWGTEQQCRFCGIGLSLASGATVLEKKPDELACAAQQAVKLDGVTHATLTSGVRRDEAEGIRHYAHCIESIKQSTGLPVHAQIYPPRDKKMFAALRDAGADTLGIHIETCSVDILRRIAPGKANTQLKTYIGCWEEAVKVFGQNQVSSFMIAGFGETEEKMMKGVELLCSIGVFPYLLPLRPVPGTPMEAEKPPAPASMVLLYEQAAVLLKKYGLASDRSKAGCVRCGACSALALFEV